MVMHPLIIFKPLAWKSLAKDKEHVLVWNFEAIKISLSYKKFFPSSFVLTIFVTVTVPYLVITGLLFVLLSFFLYALKKALIIHSTLNIFNLGSLINCHGSCELYLFMR